MDFFKNKTIKIISLAKNLSFVSEGRNLKKKISSMSVFVIFSTKASTTIQLYFYSMDMDAEIEHLALLYVSQKMKELEKAGITVEFLKKTIRDVKIAKQCEAALCSACQVVSEKTHTKLSKIN